MIYTTLKSASIMCYNLNNRRSQLELYRTDTVWSILLSTGRFQEWIQAWVHSRTKIHWGPYGRKALMLNIPPPPMFKYREHQINYRIESTMCSMRVTGTLHFELYIHNQERRIFYQSFQSLAVLCILRYPTGSASNPLAPSPRYIML